MAVMPVLPEGNQSGMNIAGILSALIPAFGSGKTTTNQNQSQTLSGTSTRSLAPGMQGQVDALLQQILGQNSQADSLIGAILERSRQSFAPAIGTSLGSGNRAYSDTTLRRLADDAATRAAQEAAAVKLNFIQGNQKLATDLVNNVVDNTGTTTNTQTTNITGTTTAKTGASPVGQALGLGAAALGGYSLYKQFTGKKKPAIQKTGTSGTGIDPATGVSYQDISGMFSGTSAVPNAMDQFNFPMPQDQAASMAAINDSFSQFSGIPAFSNPLGGLEAAVNNLSSDGGGSAFDMGGNAGAEIGDTASETGGDLIPTEEAAKYSVGEEVFTPDESQQLMGFTVNDAITGEPLLNEAGNSFVVGPGGKVIGMGSEAGGDILTDLGSGFFGEIAGDMGGDFFGDAAGEIGGEFLDEAIGGFGKDLGADIFGEVGGDIFGDVLGGGFPLGSIMNLAEGDYASAGLSLIGNIIFPGVGGIVGGLLGGLIDGDSVICTELYRQGLMPKELYVKDVQFAKRHISVTTLRGYRFWAVPFVKRMRKSKRLSKVAAFFAIKRAQSLEGKSLFGSIFRKVFEPICYLIGLCVSEVNWKDLYGTI